MTREIPEKIAETFFATNWKHSLQPNTTDGFLGRVINTGYKIISEVLKDTASFNLNLPNKK